MRHGELNFMRNLSTENDDILRERETLAERAMGSDPIDAVPTENGARAGRRQPLRSRACIVPTFHGADVRLRAVAANARDRVVS